MTTENNATDQITVAACCPGSCGDLLSAAVNVARFLGADPEIALKKANRKFQTRFQWMEAVALAEGRPLAELPRERMEELWNLSKLQPPHEAAHTK